jgi:hypothetical protein
MTSGSTARVERRIVNVLCNERKWMNRTDLTQRVGNPRRFDRAMNRLLTSGTILEAIGVRQNARGQGYDALVYRLVLGIQLQSARGNLEPGTLMLRRAE